MSFGRCTWVCVCVLVWGQGVAPVKNQDITDCIYVLNNNKCIKKTSRNDSNVCFILVCWGCVWRRPCGDTWGADAQSTSYACWATRQSWRDLDHLLCAGGQAASVPELLCSPASAPTWGEERRRETIVRKEIHRENEVICIQFAC